MTTTKSLSILAVALVVVFIGVVILGIWNATRQQEVAAAPVEGSKPTYTPTSAEAEQLTETATATAAADQPDGTGTPNAAPTETQTPTPSVPTLTPTSDQVCEVSVIALAEYDEDLPNRIGDVQIPVPYIRFYLIEENGLVPPVSQMTGEDGRATLYQTIPGCPEVSFTLVPDTQFLYPIYGEQIVEGIGAGIHSEPYEFALYTYSGTILPTPPAAGRQLGIPVNTAQGPTCKEFPEAELPNSHDDVYIGAAPDGTVWVNYQGAGVRRFDPITETWTTFTEQDGLISNEVRKVEVAPNGVVWFGTTYGVSSYDGTTWRSYDNSHGLFQEEVNTIGFGLDGTVWFASWSGNISSFNPATGAWHTHHLNSSMPEYSMAFFEIFGAADGSMWFGTMSDGAVRLRFPTGDPTQPEWTFFNRDGEYTENSLMAANWHNVPLTNAYGIDQTPDGTIWVSGTGVLGIAPDLQQYRRIGEWAFYSIDLDVAPDGTIWSAMHGGLWHIFPDRDPNAPDAWVSYDFSSLIHNQRIVEVDVINDKVIWLYGWDAPVRCIFP